MRVFKSTRSYPALMGLFIGLVFTLGSASFSNAATITVNSLGDAAATDGQCTLREAITNAQTNSATTAGDCAAGTGDDTINFSVSGTILLGSTLPTITIEGGALTIDGTGRSVILDGQNAVRIMVMGQIISFALAVGANVTLNNLTIANGKAVGSEGGGIRNNTGTLAVDNCTFTGNSSSGFGGAIFSTGNFNGSNSTLTITNSNFSGNSASHGGGVHTVSGSLTIASSSFTGNSAIYSGGAACSTITPRRPSPAAPSPVTPPEFKAARRGPPAPPR